MRSWCGSISGEVTSKANSRQAVPRRTKKGKTFVAFIKSDKALAFEEAAEDQLPVISPLLQGRLRVTMKIFYTWEGPDLDESLVLDVLQGRIYKNDRQVREKHIVHAIDADNPRVIIKVEEIAEDLPLMAAAAPADGEQAA